MNAQQARKLKQTAKRDYKDLMRVVLALPWYQRVQWAWFVCWHHI
jgi:hypothetical protein